MTRLAIVVEFRLKPGVRQEFRRLIDRNATLSARTEPGCQRFDVLEPQDRPDSVFLYEIYDDQAAFEAHLRSAHFAAFDAASGPYLADKTIVIRCDLACEGGSAPLPD